MSWQFFKDYAHQVSVAVALFLIFTTGIIIEVLLIFRQPFPDGYGDWLLLLGALAGVNVAGLGALRATSVPYAEAKARGKALGKGPQLNVEGDANITQERQVPTDTSEQAIPRHGVPPRDPNVRRPIEEYAARQRAAADDDDPGII